jgi:hypothetical protein
VCTLSGVTRLSGISQYVIASDNTDVALPDVNWPWAVDSGYTDTGFAVTTWARIESNVSPYAPSAALVNPLFSLGH